MFSDCISCLRSQPVNIYDDVKLHSFSTSLHSQHIYLHDYINGISHITIYQVDIKQLCYHIIKRIGIVLQGKKVYCDGSESIAKGKKKKKKEVHLAKGKHFSRSDNCTLKLSVSLSCLLRNPRVTKTGVIIYIADILSSVR